MSVGTEPVKKIQSRLEKTVVSNAVVTPSVCKNCGSLERTDYEGIRSHSHDGITTTWKNCGCVACGQRRVDIFRETENR